MQKWEYLVIKMDYSEFSGYRPRYVNGQELKDWKKLPLHELLNQLGAEGWEMSGSFSFGGRELFFKRPKP